MRSKPFTPNSAAILQHSSRLFLGPKTPRVTACLRRPLRVTAGVAPAAPAKARAEAPAAGSRLRRVISLYGRGRQAARQIVRRDSVLHASPVAILSCDAHGTIQAPPVLHSRRDPAGAWYRNRRIHP